MIENPMVTGLTARYAYLRWQMLDALLPVLIAYGRR
jgi:hypothetical protein